MGLSSCVSCHFGSFHKVLGGPRPCYSFSTGRAAIALPAMHKPLITNGRQQTKASRKSSSELVDIEECVEEASSSGQGEIDCIGTGTDVECVLPDMEADFKFGGTVPQRAVGNAPRQLQDVSESSFLISTLETLVLVSPFFFWGTAMVAMKGVLPKAGPFFVASTRLIPAGLLLVGFAAFRGRRQPSGLKAWFSICVFSLIDAACFQGFLAEGLGKTSAGLGSVIIDSQPLTVAVLAALLFDETIGLLGILGLILGVVGLVLLEVPVESLFSFQGLISSFSTTSIWNSGEWYMLLAAQSMAIGTLLVRWVCKYSDPVMATGWHMIIGGVPLLALAALHNEPSLTGGLGDLQIFDWSCLAYTSLFGSAVSYGVFFYNATRGSLTKLSSLTFLTPMFAAFFGYIFLGESLTTLQMFGASVTIAAIYLVNAK